MNGALFGKYEKDLILYGLNEYCIEKKILQNSTVKTYLRIIEVYFDYYVVDKIQKNDFTEIFNSKYLNNSKKHIKNNANSAAFIALLDFLYDEKFIDDEMFCFKKKNEIKEIFGDRDYTCIMQDKIPSKCKLKFQHPSVI